MVSRVKTCASSHGLGARLLVTCLLTGVISHEVGSSYLLFPFHLDGGSVSGVAALRTKLVGIVLKKREIIESWISLIRKVLRFA